ncbi:MAG: glycine cleavage system protein GcvH [Eubacteriaceae bacterium]|nr:glycine cleavage system protein GcvH [Eubacteriaceae bacterium]
MSIVEGSYYFTKDHEWVKAQEGKIALVGVSDFAQSSLGDIAYVELPQEGDEYAAGDVFGVLESPKAASEMYMPVSGKVLEANTSLEETPEQINENAASAWVIKISFNDESEFENLLSEADYEAMLKESGH